jgi:CRISPR-associated protein Csd1
MLRTLVETSRNLASSGAMIHPGYREFSKSNPIDWVLHIGPDGRLMSRPEKVEIRKPRPSRIRTGKPGPGNLKPYLLVDEARYVLGVPEPGKAQEAELLHSGFVDLLREAYESTQASYLATILEYLTRHLDRASLASQIAPRDVVTFKVGDIYPFEHDEMQAFWATYISEKTQSGFSGQCSVCGQYRGLMQTLPKNVFVLNQSCQITSFNSDAYRSFGKEQTVNASICVACGLLAAQTLEHFLINERHTTVLARDDSRGGSSNPLRNQVAVFWLTKEEEEPVVVEGREIFLFETLTGVMTERLVADVVPTLQLIRKTISSPFTGQTPAKLGSNTFCLAVVSANKARLVVREWIRVPVESSLYNLGRYIQALQIIGPRGEETRAFPIREMMSVLKVTSPNILRGLLRTAYVGHHVPPGLLEAAVRRMRVVAHTSDDRFAKDTSYHVLASAVKLAITYGTKEAEVLERMDITRDKPGYLCGRLLAILEELQRRASRSRLNVTLVERVFGSASTSPITIFPGLLKLAETAYLPKIRKENRGYVKMKTLLQDVCAKLDDRFPSTLTLKEQGEFVLGFYHQRAWFAEERAQTRTTAKQEEWKSMLADSDKCQTKSEVC